MTGQHLSGSSAVRDRIHEVTVSPSDDKSRPPNRGEGSILLECIQELSSDSSRCPSAAPEELELISSRKPKMYLRGLLLPQRCGLPGV